MTATFPKQSSSPIPCLAACGATGIKRGQLIGRLAAPLFSEWQIERANRIHKLFLAVEGKLSSGLPLTRALRIAARPSNHRRPYRCEPSRPFRLTYPTLVRNYYQWRDHGRTPAALLPRYKTARASSISPALFRDFIQQCAAPGVLSMQSVYRRLQPSCTISARSFYRAAAFAGMADELRRLHRARLTLRQAEHRFARALRERGIT